MAQEEAQQATPSQDLPQLPHWVCRVEGTPQESQWTVGEVFYLECEGPEVEFQSSQLKFLFPKGQEYALHIINVEKQSGNTLTLKATTYKPGTHNFKDLPIAEGETPKLLMEPLQLSVDHSRPSAKTFWSYHGYEDVLPGLDLVCFGGIYSIVGFLGNFPFSP